MAIVISSLLFIAGLILAVKCSAALVDSAVWIADTTGVSRFAIGATVLSLATTLPELILSVMGVLGGKEGMAFGNVIGSVSCNIGLVMGLSLFVLPGAQVDKQVRSSGTAMLAAAGMLMLFSLDGMLTQAEAMVLLVMFFLCFYSSLSARMHHEKRCAKKQATRTEMTGNTLKFFVGIGGTVLGAQLLTDNGILISRFAGVSENIVGLTLLAIGTSLPELLITATAIAKKEPALSIGNIFGANIINMTLVCAVCALVGGGMSIPREMRLLHIPVALCFLLLAVIPALIGGRFHKKAGGIMILSYVGYGLLLLFLA